MPALRIDGYVIVSADGMLADAGGVMPAELKFEGDKRFFTAALHFNRFIDDDHIAPFAIDFVLIGVGGINFFDKQILHIRPDVGEAPGNAVIVTDDDARRARK